MNNIEQVEQFYKRNDLNSFKNIKNDIGILTFFQEKMQKQNFFTIIKEIILKLLY